MTVLSISFENFKKLARNSRLYIYEGEAFYDFHFLADGIVVKSGLLKQEIENTKQFFSDKMFYGAVQLDFNIPLPKVSILTEQSSLKTPLMILDDQDNETKNNDIQEEGVK